MKFLHKPFLYLVKLTIHRDYNPVEYLQGSCRGMYFINNICKLKESDTSIKFSTNSTFSTPLTLSKCQQLLKRGGGGHACLSTILFSLLWCETENVPVLMVNGRMFDQFGVAQLQKKTILFCCSRQNCNANKLNY